MKIDPAFPLTLPSVDGDSNYYYHGMTLRDYFAAKAMQGMLTGTLGRFDDGTLSAYKSGKCNHVIADRAYVIADAMLKEREGKS